MMISVITPCLNSEKYINRCIASIIQQNYLNFQHIIVDGGSQDNTLSILNKYGHLCWTSEQDRGQSDALNKGFNKASGDIIGWLNADEFYLRDCLKKVSLEFDNNPEIDIIYGNVILVDENYKLIRTKQEINFDPQILKYYGCYISTAATFFRKKVFDENNFLDTSFHYTMDYEFFVRLALKGYKFKHINEYLAAFLVSPNNKSADINMRTKDRIRVQKKYAYKNQHINNTLSHLYHLKHALLKILYGRLDTNKIEIC